MSDDRFEDIATLPYDPFTSLEEIDIDFDEYEGLDDDEYAALEEKLEPTAEDPRFSGEDIDVDLLSAQTVASTLPINADKAYEIFNDIEAVPNWVSIVKSISVLEWTGSGRPKRAAYLSRLKGASIGYTLQYEYDEDDLTARWYTKRGSATNVRGRVRFTPLGDKACLMEYKLLLDLPAGALPSWDDPIYDHNAASAVVNEFREYIQRHYRK